ncbi:hypothetical protein G6L37_35155 [Agrobacterium rubi]|nr:hypothetical protein [Agrobacterium rubi]NTF23809.1 hypothetical protein [Agrobacterium rubi]
MPDQHAHWWFMRSELDSLPHAFSRSSAASHGAVFHDKHSFDQREMSDDDIVFHHARLTHSKKLVEISDMLRKAWFESEYELRGTTYGVQDDDVELAFTERLGAWLRDHAAYVSRVAAGGEIEPRFVNAGPRQIDLYLAAHRLYAVKHHEMISDYCARMVALLEHRATEIRHAMSSSGADSLAGSSAV